MPLGRLIHTRSLQSQHACDKLQTVLHAMIGLFQKRLLVGDRPFQTLFCMPLLDGQREQIGNSLQKGQILDLKFARLRTEYLKSTEGLCLPMECDVDCAPDAMAGRGSQQPERTIVLYLITDYRITGENCMSG